MGTMIRIGAIGAGHWGPNHLRVFNQMKDVQVVSVADLDEKRRKATREIFPNIKTVKDYNEILSDKSIEAVVICTPTKTHYEIVKASLIAEKHVLCEKPLCTEISEGNELLELAKSYNKILMIGNIFLFNSGIDHLREIILNKNLGSLQYLSATRTNLGPVRQDVNAVYDLATHDISIFNYLLGSSPLEVSAVGMSYLKSNIEDVAFINLTYPQGILANIHVSWLDPKKVRQITLVGDLKMATWDDLGDLGPITIYDKGIVKQRYYHDFGEFQLLTREGDITIPKIPMVEPLKSQNIAFIQSVKSGATNISDGLFGLEIVKTLKAINTSIELKGQSVAVE